MNTTLCHRCHQRIGGAYPIPLMPPHNCTPADARPLPRIYIAGPITSRPATYQGEFRDAAATLRGLGFDVVNPVELNTAPAPFGWGMTLDESSTAYREHWRQCMRVDIHALTQCDAVALLPGWKQSRGAEIEHYIATALGMPAQPLTHWVAMGRKAHSDTSFVPPTTA